MADEERIRELAQEVRDGENDAKVSDLTESAVRAEVEAEKWHGIMTRATAMHESYTRIAATIWDDIHELEARDK